MNSKNKILEIWKEKLTLKKINILKLILNKKSTGKRESTKKIFLENSKRKIKHFLGNLE